VDPDRDPDQATMSWSWIRNTASVPVPIYDSETVPLSVADPEESAKRSLIFRPKQGSFLRFFRIS
jgi:hypothetical protein